MIEAMPVAPSEPLFVWACLPDRPDLARVYTVLTALGCDNISFVHDLTRVPLGIQREDSPCGEDKPKDDISQGSLRPESSHGVSLSCSDTSCSRSITPPSSTGGGSNSGHRPVSPVKSEPSDDGDNEDIDISVESPTPEDEEVVMPEREKVPFTMPNLNFHAIANLLGQAHAAQMLNFVHAKSEAMSSALTDTNAASDSSSYVEPGPSVDLSFLRNVPPSDIKDKSVTCQICEKSFSRNARNVSRHAATHFPRAAARYTCGKCGESFGRNDRAKYHVDTKHGGLAELHDKAKDSEYSDEWVKAVKQCFPGFDFSPRDTHTRTPNTSVETAESVAPAMVVSEPSTDVNVETVCCALCSYSLFSTAPVTFAIEHAATHCTPQFTCSVCGQLAEKRAEIDEHVASKHSGSAEVLDSGSQSEPQLRELANLCFPSRTEDLDKAFEDRARNVTKKRRIDSLIESKKKVMKMG